MTTTIAPASGAGALFTQQGVGTTPGFTALDDRRSNSGALQEGVFGTPTLVTAGGVGSIANADFMVTQRGAGANVSVDVNMPAGGFAYVQGDTINGQGLYCVPVHSANINEGIAAADPTNPRVDQVILEVQDNVLDASGGNLARTRVLTGTATVGATLANRTGAAALPGSALLLADVLVPAAAASIPNSGIRDRRKWARGAYFRFARTAGSYTTVSTTQAEIDTTNLKPRIECSGAPVEVVLTGSCGDSVAATAVLFGLFLDGAGVDSTTFLGGAVHPTAAASVGALMRYVAVPAAGSHQFSPTFATAAAGTATLTGTAANPAVLTVRELPVQNAANSNGVTTG